MKKKITNKNVLWHIYKQTGHAINTVTSHIHTHNCRDCLCGQCVTVDISCSCIWFPIRRFSFVELVAMYTDKHTHAHMKHNIEMRWTACMCEKQRRKWSIEMKGKKKQQTFCEEYRSADIFTKYFPFEVRIRKSDCEVNYSGCF